MPTNLRTSESKFFEQVRIALTNAEAHEEIKNTLASYGMGTVQIAEGWKVYNNARTVWEWTKKEEVESRVAANSFKVKYEAFNNLFKEHRSKVKKFFHKQPQILVMLGVKGNYPIKYNELFDKSGMFYNMIKDNAGIQNEMNKIKLNTTLVNECILLREKLMAERANYDRELGESQNATKSKNTAIAELRNWIENFEAVCKVAFYHKPQLLEVLGMYVSSQNKAYRT